MEIPTNETPFTIFKKKVQEIGDTPVPLKHAVAAVVVTMLIVRPPRSWLVLNSAKLHRV